MDDVISIILDIVKTILGIDDDSKDKLLTIYIDMAINTILNHCNRDDFPEELFYVAADMVETRYWAKTRSKANEGKGMPQSFSEDGRSITFGTGGGAAIDAEEFKRMADTRQSELNRFKLPYRMPRVDNNGL